MESILDQTYRLPSGYSVPVLGLGTRQLVGSTCEMGYRQIDTTELYGNEREIGGAIKGMQEIDEVGVEMKIVDATCT